MKHQQQYTEAAIPIISVNPNYVSFYTEKKNRSFTKRFIDNQKNLKNNDTKGIISVKASKRINQSLSWFAALSSEKVRTSKNNIVIKHRLAFITLTLSDTQKHSDQFIKQRMLNWFINEVKTRFGVTSYLWRAEAQENKNIHFHIVVNAYIHYTHVRNIWNNIQRNFGYTQRYTDQHGADKQPPSTEIKAVYKCKNIAGYLSKYCSKDHNVLRFKTDATRTHVADALKVVSNDGEITNIPGIIAVSKNEKKGEWNIKFQKADLKFDFIEDQLKKYGVLITDVKRVELRPIQGRLWFLSQSLQKIKNVSEIAHEGYRELHNSLEKGLINAKKIVKDYCTTYIFPFYQNLEFELFESLNYLFNKNKRIFVIHEHQDWLRAYKLYKSKQKPT